MHEKRTAEGICQFQALTCNISRFAWLEPIDASIRKATVVRNVLARMAIMKSEAHN
jgi:hypothetical protein